MSSYRDWIAYQKSYKLAVDIFLTTKTFPSNEKFSLIDQVRRSSRSVTANISESYIRRRYQQYFISKLNDAEIENTETRIWLDFSFDFKYLPEEKYKYLISQNDEVGKLLWYMINHPEKFL